MRLIQEAAVAIAAATFAVGLVGLSMKLAHGAEPAGCQTITVKGIGEAYGGPMLELRGGQLRLLELLGIPHQNASEASRLFVRISPAGTAVLVADNSGCIVRPYIIKAELWDRALAALLGDEA